MSVFCFHSISSERTDFHPTLYIYALICTRSRLGWLPVMAFDVEQHEQRYSRAIVRFSDNASYYRLLIYNYLPARGLAAIFAI